MSTPAAYLEDALLVDRCLGGEQAAARELFRREHRRVQATLYRVLGGNRDMDDLIQEVFLQVFTSLRGYRAEARLSTWIDRVAVRVAYRYLAGKKRQPVAVDMVADEPPAPRLSLHAQAVAREGVRRLYGVLAELPPAARIAFALHVLDGRAVKEVAELTGTTVTATKVRIWRARRALDKAAERDPLLAELVTEDDA